MSTTVIRAQNKLRVALSEEAQQRRENAREEIKRLSAEGAALRAELEPMAAQVRRAQNDRLRLHGELVHARAEIARYAAPLDPHEFPTAKDEAVRAKQLRWWRAEQKRLLAAHEDARQRESVRIEAIRLQNRVNQIHSQLNNLTVVAEGRELGRAEGGIFTTGEDFLGHTDRRFD